VHETRGSDGEPSGLQLAYAAPRAWLRPGRRIEVRAAPTSFGPVSFSISTAEHSARVVVEVPARRLSPRLIVRLRLPLASRITAVRLDGAAFGRFDAATGTIDLSGRRGRIVLAVRVSS
jgi:hypothetical protein